MKIIPKLISTVFTKTVNSTDTDLIIKNAETVLLSYGQIKKSTGSNVLCFRSRLVHHLFFHPFFLVIRSSINIFPNGNGKIDIKYSVFHPLSIIIPCLLYFFIPIDLRKPMTYAPLLLFFCYSGIIFFMQLSIFKKMILSKKKRNVI